MLSAPKEKPPSPAIAAIAMLRYAPLIPLKRAIASRMPIEMMAMIVLLGIFMLLSPFCGLCWDAVGDDEVWWVWIPIIAFNCGDGSYGVEVVYRD